MGGLPDNRSLRLVLLVGLGDETPGDFRRAGAALARHTVDHDTVATTVAAAGGGEALTAFVVGAMLGSFGFHWRSEGPEHQPVRRVVLAAIDDDASADLERGLELGGAGWRARMLATVPSNLKSPQWLAEQAEALAAEHGLACEIWDEQKLARKGFGGVLAVGQASATPPRLIRLDYTPPRGARKAPRVVLVGKGITFDTGGLSIKPGEAMSTMKRDMTGGAVVMAVLAALGRMGCPFRVTGLVPAAENAIGGNALRPGDVLTQYGGRTTEVLNTDAEGRLVLADAMAYAVDELDPAVLVDVATLTGAIKVALGQRVGAFFANDDRLAARLFDAGAASGEPLWRMPLESDYEDTLSSTVADAKNNPGGPGAITAALFLQHFAGDVPWAHLDLASVGDSPSESFEWTHRPVRLRRPRAADLADRARGPRRHRPMSGLRGLTVRWSLADAPDGVEQRAGRLRRGHVVRPVQRAARPGLQDVADGAGRVVRGLLRVRGRGGAGGVPGELHGRSGGRARKSGSSAAHRS